MPVSICYWVWAGPGEGQGQGQSQWGTRSCEMLAVSTPLTGRTQSLPRPTVPPHPLLRARCSPSSSPCAQGEFISHSHYVRTHYL